MGRSGRMTFAAAGRGAAGLSDPRYSTYPLARR